MKETTNRNSNKTLTAAIALGVAALWASLLLGPPLSVRNDVTSDATLAATQQRPAESAVEVPANGVSAESSIVDVDFNTETGVADAATTHVYTMDLPEASVARESSADDADDTDRKSGSPRDKMSGAVAALAEAGGPQLVDIVVQYDEHPELFDDNRVAQLGGEVVRGYQSLDMRAIRLPADSLEDLAIEDNVDWLSLDSAVVSFSVASREAAGLPATGSANAAYEGLDIGIAVVDTGISRHSDLGENFLQFSFLDGAYPTPVIVDGNVVDPKDDAREDKFGHGTHVAGILVGNGIDSQGQYEGSAKTAKVLALQVLDHKGAGQMSDVMAALDWLYQYGAYFDVRVVNLSLGMGIAESNTTDPLVLAVERLWDAGMVVVVSAGNEGSLGNMTITSPGNSRKVITVGSLTDSTTGNDFTDDYVSTFSSRGPTVGDLVLKPDLVAPGNRLVAAIDHNAKLKNELPSRVVGCLSTSCTSEYLELSGTSMAAPMVAAAAARMLQKDPALTPATVKARLMRSARKIDDEPTAAGAGVLDVDAALGDTGVLTGEALSPLMYRDDTTGDILVEDTADLWGDSLWGAGYLFSGGFNWVDGYSLPDSTVNANGYLWTDGDVWAKGYLWTDGEGIFAKGYLWTDGDDVNPQSLLDGSDETGYVLNDD